MQKRANFLAEKNRKKVGLFFAKKLEKSWKIFEKKSGKNDEKKHSLKPFGTVTVPNGLRAHLFSSVLSDFFQKIFQLFSHVFPKKVGKKWRAFHLFFSKKKMSVFFREKLPNCTIVQLLPKSILAATGTSRQACFSRSKGPALGERFWRAEKS